MKKVLALVLAFALVFALCACGGSSEPAADEGGEAVTEPVVLSCGTTTPETDSFTYGCYQFASYLEEATNGAYTVEVYPSSQLGDERTMIEGVQMGTIDMCACTDAPYTNFVAEIGALDMPFLFKDETAVHAVIDGEVGQEMLTTLEGSGIKGLTFIDKGMRQMCNSAREITTVDGMKNLKVRVMESEVYLAAFEALGCNVITMSFTELFTALEQGAVEGAENAFDIFVSYSFWDYCKYVSKTNHTHSHAILSINEDLFNSFPEDIQATMLECAKKASDDTNAYQEVALAEAEAQLGENGMEVVDVEYEGFRSAVDGVYANYPQYSEWIDKMQAVFDTL